MQKKQRGKILSAGCTGTGATQEPVRLPPGVIHPIDMHVGSRLRARRTLLGMTQKSLAESIGLTFQQVQKYERGANRISASRLFTFGTILDVPVSFFYEGLDAGAADPAEGYRRAMSGDLQATDNADSIAAKRETLELVRAYCAINDSACRAAFLGTVRALASASARRHERKDC